MTQIIAGAKRYFRPRGFSTAGASAPVAPAVPTSMGELVAIKWLDCTEKQKRRSNVCDKQTDRWTDRQSQRQKIIDARLGAEINRTDLVIFCNNCCSLWGCLCQQHFVFDTQTLFCIINTIKYVAVLNSMHWPCGPDIRKTSGLNKINSKLYSNRSNKCE